MTRNDVEALEEVLYNISWVRAMALGAKELGMVHFDKREIRDTLSETNAILAELTDKVEKEANR
jgi:hypothetical protein